MEQLMQQIPIEMLKPHPDNPRKDLGDLTELAESIKVRGVMQNLTVIKDEDSDNYTILIGHRRCAAAKMAGVTTLPCTVVAGMSHKEQIAVMLLENMQRSDLTPLEQAEGFQLMLDLGDDIKSIETKTGFSASTIRHRVKLLDLNKEDLKKAQEREVNITDYIKLEKLKSQEDKNECLKCIGTKDFYYTYNAKLRKQDAEEKSKVIKSELAELDLIDISEENQIYIKYEFVNAFNYTRELIEQLIEKYNDEQLYFCLSPHTTNWISIYKNKTKVVEDDTERRQAERDKLKKIEEEKQRKENIKKVKISELQNCRDVARATVDEFVDKYTGRKGDEHTLFNYLVKLETDEEISISRKSADKITNHQKDYDYKTDKNICRKLLLYIRATIRHNYYNDDYDAIDDFYDDDAEYMCDDVRETYLSFIELLENLDYQVADEERSYYNGTHEAFAKSED